MSVVDAKNDREWLTRVRDALAGDGYAVVENVVNSEFLQRTREGMYAVQEAMVRDVGRERLERARELGVLRLMMKFDPHFYRFLELQELLAVLDATLGETAIMHLQNGFILPSLQIAPSVSQNSFHMDFPRLLNGFVASINCFFAVDDFTRANGCTRVVPGSHQKFAAADVEHFDTHAVDLECRAGAMIVFDSTLWHAAGFNTSGQDRLGINHQFTRSYIKQQIDYVRALGAADVVTQTPRTQQILGWYTRVVTSLDEYYQPTDKRLYRAGQG